jgi:hypothetical protein
MIKKAKWYVKKNYLTWGFTITKGFLVSYISFFLLKYLTHFGFVIDFWEINEKYYLTTYVSLQFVVGFILYELIGYVVGLAIYSFIKQKRMYLNMQMHIQEKKSFVKFLILVTKIFMFFGAINNKDLERLDEIATTEKEFNIKWNNTIKLVKSVLGILILSIGAWVITWNQNVWFWIAVVYLVAIIVTSVVFLICYYLIIRNIKFINSIISSYNISNRIVRKDKLLSK